MVEAKFRKTSTKNKLYFTYYFLDPRQGVRRTSLAGSRVVVAPDRQSVCRLCAALLETDSQTSRAASGFYAAVCADWGLRGNRTEIVMLL